MKRFFVLVLLSICLINMAFAQQMAVIDPELYTIMNSKSGGKISVNIILKEQVDVNEQSVRVSFSSGEDRRAYMVNEMKTQTENLQADVLKTLKANERSVQVTDIKCHWLTNVITCNATPDAILKIAEHPDVEAIIYNKKQKLLLDGNDEKTVATRAASADVVTSVEYVNAPQVWNMGFTGKDVIVAVIDTGVNTEHEDLKDHLWNDGNGHHGKNTLDDINFPDYTDEYDITDVDGHGTHCAGTICGDGTSGLITGVAPDATLMCIKALDNEGNGSLESILAGVEYALENNANVLSMSLGFSYPMHYVSQTLRNVFEQALDLGVVAAVAAGNDGTKLDEYQVPRNINAPGNCPPPWIHPDQKSNEGEKTSVVCVGAIREEDDALCSFSSVGPVTWQNTTYNDYKLGSGYPTKIIRYDNDDYEANLQGVSGDYGVMFEPSMLAEFANGGKLMSVFIGNGYSDNGYMFVYQGGATSPGTEIHTQSYQLDATGGMKEIVLNKDVQIDIKQNLWVVFSSWTNPLIPVASNTDNANGRWVKKGGVWTNSAIDKMIKINVNISTSNVVEEEKIGLIRPDICAPGFQIKSTSADYPNSYYEIKNGTSMATPCVAGAMALLLDAAPNLTPEDICRVLETTAVKLSETKNNETGSGRINVYEAVLSVATDLPFVAPTLTATAKSSSRIDLSWTIAPGADSYTIYRNDSEIATGLTATSYSDTDLNPETTYSYEIEAIRGSESVKSSAVSATTKAESAAIAGQYRIKVSTSTHEHYGKYLNIKSNNLPASSNDNDTYVNVSAYAESNNQIFTLEDAGNGNYYLRSGNDYYIKCGTTGDEYWGKYWNVYAHSTTEKTPLYFYYADANNFYISDNDKMTGANHSVSMKNNSYFKVENGNIFCDADLSNADVVTWTLEPVESSTPEPEEPEQPTPPATPTGLVATVQGTTSIALSWDAVDGATSYNVYRNSSVNPIVTVATGTSYTDTNLTSATNYCYTVSAVNANVDLESEKSAEVCETTEAESETPSVSQYRIKAVGRSASASVSYYLNIENNNQHPTGSKGGVGLAAYAENDSQIFEIEEIYGSQVYVKSASGYYIYCNGGWNVDAFSTYSATSLEFVDTGLGDNTFYIKSSKGWFKVGKEDGGTNYYPYSDGDTSNREKWMLEPVGSSTPEPEEPTVPDTQGCNVIFTLEDSYGDGWNSGYVRIYDGNSIDEVLDFQNPGDKSIKTKTHTLSIPQGTVITAELYTGLYPQEMSLTIAYEGGENIYTMGTDNGYAGNEIKTILSSFTVDCGIVEEMYEEFSGSGDWNYATNWSTNALPDENSNVSVSGDVIINSDVTVKTLVINDGGSVTVESGKLTVTDGMTNNDASAFIINDGAQVVQGNDNVKATFLMNVEAPESWTEDHSNGWQFIASPMKDFSSIEFETEGIDYALFKYDGTKELQWVNYKNHGTDFEAKLQQGRGYLASYETESVVEFAGVLNNDTEFTFDEINMFNEGDHYANFYLLGNPFAFDVKWNNSNITTSGLAEGYAVVTLDGGYSYATIGDIKVGDGFFVKVVEDDATPSLTYTANKISRNKDNSFINIIASSKAGSDNVIINFADNGREGFTKFENFNQDIAEIYLREDENRYGILNYSEDVEEINIYFNAKKMGNYTINAVTNAVFSNVTLVDRFTGIETNLLASSYTFQATANDNQDRFMLRMSREVENENFVYQSGDELIIKAKGAVQIIDVMGRVVYSADVINNNHKINLSNYDNAAYIVRVVNVNEVKTQKIIVY